MISEAEFEDGDAVAVKSGTESDGATSSERGQSAGTEGAAAAATTGGLQSPTTAAMAMTTASGAAGGENLNPLGLLLVKRLEFKPRFWDKGIYTGTYKLGYSAGEKASWDAKKKKIPSGHGTMVWEDGWRYMGEWESGAPHGHGAVLADNGKISICSSFKKGRAHGWGIEFDYYGRRVFQGQFIDGVKQSTGLRLDKEAKVAIAKSRNLANEAVEATELACDEDGMDDYNQYLILRDLKLAIEDAKAKNEQENAGDPMIFTVNHIGERLGELEKKLKLLLENAGKVGLKSEEALYVRMAIKLLAKVSARCELKAALDLRSVIKMNECVDACAKLGIAEEECRIFAKTLDVLDGMAGYDI